MSAKKNKTVRVHLKFGPTVITPEKRFDATGALRALLSPMPGSLITLLDMHTWTFGVDVPEGTPFGMLLFGGLFEITKKPVENVELPWEPRAGTAAPARA